MAKEINQHILEIRYKPNPKILDYRGTWAEMISSHMKLPEWHILENRIDIYDKAHRNHAFVGFRNSGFVCNNSPAKSYFPNRAVRFCNFVVGLDGFEKQPFVERLGIRSKFCTSFAQGFEELKNRYASKYLHLTKEAKEVINARLVDIGGPLNFADRLGNFNTMSGPMEKKQILRFFENIKENEVPDVGLYYDIDYWLKPNRKMNIDEISTTIKEFAECSWDRYGRIKNLVLGD